MADIPDTEREAAQAALAPTLDATASILPLLAKTREPRFSPDLGARWLAAARRLGAAWGDRYGAGFEDIRPAIFALIDIALLLKDGDCLALAEALATAADRLDEPESLGDGRLVAGLSAAIDIIQDPGGLEHPAFFERARHFTARLTCAATTADSHARSAALDRLFVGEARECLEQAAAAMAALPPDPFSLKSAASRLSKQAELVELPEIATQAGQLVRLMTLRAGESVDLDAADMREQVESLLAELTTAVDAIQ